jgi:hypothetical protein
VHANYDTLDVTRATDSNVQAEARPAASHRNQDSGDIAVQPQVVISTIPERLNGTYLGDSLGPSLGSTASAQCQAVGCEYGPISPPMKPLEHSKTRDSMEAKQVRLWHVIEALLINHFRS